MAIFSDPSFLRRCDELKGLLRPNVFEPGSKVSRGYADLGYEEFVVLPNHKILSLYSGKISEIPEGHAQHFFWVPSATELLDEITKRAEVLGIDFLDQRTWRIRFALLSDQQPKESLGPSLDETLLEARFQIGAAS